MDYRMLEDEMTDNQTIQDHRIVRAGITRKTNSSYREEFR